MARGRNIIGKEKLDQLYAVRISKSQKDILDKNKWIRDELSNMIRDYLDMYLYSDGEKEST